MPSPPRVWTPTVAAVVLAAAGSDREENRRIFREWADQQHLGEHFSLVHDAVAALHPRWLGHRLDCRDRLPGLWPVPQGQTARAGGWGYLMGDEGSGYALAVAGLRAAAQAADGPVAPTQLVDAFLTHFDLDQPLALVPVICRMANDRAGIAALAELVLTLAATGDSVSAALVGLAARDLAAMAAATARKLDLTARKIPLALAGLLTRKQPVTRVSTGRTRARRIELASAARSLQPVLGAIKLAQASLRRQVLNHGS